MRPSRPSARYAIPFGVLLLVLGPRLAGAQVLLDALSSPDGQPFGLFGAPISGVPDVDGDGVPDFLVGAGLENTGASAGLEGRAYVFSGFTRALLHALVSPNEQWNGFFGRSVAGIGDVDGDGRGDLLIGAHGEGEGNLPADRVGRAYVFSGAGGALLHTLVSPNPRAEGEFGWSLSGIVDLDGDGVPDLLVGAPREGATRPLGQVHVFSGATGHLLYTLESSNAPLLSRFGAAVSGVEDVDGDGRGDLLVGAPTAEGVAMDAGRAHVFSGGTGALLHTLESPNAQGRGHFGLAVSGIEDVDGDGEADLLVGSREDAGMADAAGRAYVFSGATGDLLHALRSPYPQVGGGFGDTVSGVPDVDGDGNGDFLIGAPLEGGGSLRAGRSYVFGGSTAALLYTLTSPNEQNLGFFGSSVSGVEDVDGDRRGDLLVGASGEDGGAVSAGRAYVFSGSATGTAVEGELPASFALGPVRPNPFATRTTLRYDLPAPSPVRLAVYDVLGREVAVLVDREMSAGRHEAVLDGVRLPAGTYLVRLEADDEVQALRLTRVR